MHNNGPYFFGVGNGPVSKSRERKLNAIAQRHNKQGYFIAAKMPEGPRYWFEIPNHGAPFDRDTSNAIIRDAEEAGLWPIDS